MDTTYYKVFIAATFMVIVALFTMLSFYSLISITDLPVVSYAFSYVVSF